MKLGHYLGVTNIALFAQTRVACVGDSITKGVQIKDPVADGYVGILSRALGSDFDVRNFGLSVSVKSSPH